MSQTIQLNVQVNESQALAALNSIQVKAESLAKKTYELKFNMSGAQEQAFRSIANATNNVAQGADRASAAIKKFISSTEVVKDGKTVEYIEKYQTGLNEVTTTSVKAGKAQDTLTQKITKTANVTDKATLAMQRYRDAFLQNNTNGVDFLINQRELEGKQFSKALQAKMEAEARTAAEADKAAKAADNAKKSFGSYSSEVKKATAFTDLMGDSFGRIVAKMAMWQVMGNVIATAIGAFRNALATMKEVDSELTNIQKVTDMSDAAIARLGETAYDTASKYGISANDFLESVSSFAKAGYGNAEQLSEIATKTQLVGDTTAETANKFLIATDAAYKYHGSTEQLTKVLDAANSVENNYATSIDKIAVGMPIVASTAANANVSIEELIATLGTITSVTQETGTKAATAFRALIMNIEGEIGTFLTEEGETIEVTQDGINSISDALQKYGSESIKAAKASGQIIDPLEAIGALAKAYEDGLLNDIELQNIMMNVGGKLRTNQLTALVKNFDMYESMLETIRTSAGSADKEIDIMLGSWKSKVNILQNTWTQFVSHLVETDLVKGGIDVITGAVKLLDTELGRGVIAATAFTAAFVAIDKSKIGLDALNAAMIAFDDSMMAGVGTVGALKAALASLSSVLAPLAMAAGFALLLQGIYKYADKTNTSYDEWLESIDETNKELEQAKAEYDELNARVGTLSAAEKVRKSQLEAQTKELEKQLALEREEAWLQWDRENGSGTGYTLAEGEGWGEMVRVGDSADVATLKNLKSELLPLQTIFNEGKINAQQYAESIEGIIAAFSDEYNIVSDAIEQGYEVSDAWREFADIYEEQTKLYEEGTAETEKATDALEEQKNKYDELAKAANSAKAALDDFSSSEKGDVLDEAAEKYKEFLEDWQAGRKGSNSVEDAINFFLPDEVIKRFKGNIDELGELLASPTMQNIFQGGDFGANFANMLRDAADATGELRDANGKLIATFQDAGDGTFTMEYSSLADLAKYCNISEEALGALIDAIDIFGSESSHGWEEAKALMDGLKGLEGIDLSNLSLDQLMEGINYLNGGELSTTEIMSWVSELEKLGYINLDDTIASLNELGEAAQEVADTTSEIEPDPINVEVKGEVDTESAEAAIAEFNEAARAAEEPIEITVDGEAAEQQLVVLDGLLHKMSLDYSATVSVDGAEEAASAVGAVVGQLAGVTDRHATVTVDVVVNGGLGGLAGLGLGLGFGAAEGTDNANAGATLVNEEGAELITQDGKAFIAGGGEPTFVNLKQGAVVLTHEETQKALNNKKPPMVFQAAASGIPILGGGGSSGGGLASAISASSGSKTSGANLEKKSDELDEKLKLIDAQIKLAENQGDMERVLQLQEEAQNLIIALINDYLASGKTLDDKEVVDLLNEGYDYWNDSQDLGSDFWKDFVDSIKDAKSALDDANELEEKRQAIADAQEALANAQNQRTVRVYNRETGQWEWIADEKDIQKAQENLEKAQKSYQDALFDAELERLENAQGANLSDVLLGSAIADVIGASTEEIQNIIASALQMVSGTASYMGSNATNAGTFPTDSHDTIYTFGDITLTQEQAETTTVADLAGMLRALSLTT